MSRLGSMLGGVTSAMIFARSMETMTTLCFCFGAANGKWPREKEQSFWFGHQQETNAKVAPQIPIYVF